jgi:general L-amino acid transport system ATP-binding protein
MDDDDRRAGERAEERIVDRSKMTVSDEVAIEIIGMNKWYGEFHVLKDIDLTVYKRRADRHLRPVRLRQVDADPLHQRAGGAPEGPIIVDGTELTDDLKKIDEIRREVGMVFQHFNLFPHLTILENCTLAPIWVRKIPKKEAERRPCTSSSGSRSPSRPTSIPASSRAVSSSAWPSPARCA